MPRRAANGAHRVFHQRVCAGSSGGIVEIDSERGHEVGLARAALLHLTKNHLPPTPENYARAWDEVRKLAEARPHASHRPGRRFPEGIIESLEDGALASVRRLAERRQRLIVSLTALIETLCDIAPVLAGEDDWLSEPFSTVRRAVSVPTERVDRGELEQARQALRSSIRHQGEIILGRREALNLLKTMLIQWVGNLGELMDSSHSYHESLDQFLVRIVDVRDLDGLTEVVGGIVARTRDMRERMARTHDELEDACRRATELERRVSDLTGELHDTTTVAMTDPLTSLLNRRGLDVAWQEMQLNNRYRARPFALALLDLDHFKRINDALGYLAGDNALRYFGGVIRGQLRPDDRCCRFGGDEFVLLLPGVNLDTAVDVLRRLQRVVVERTVPAGAEEINLTFSAGVTVVKPGERLEAVLDRADEALTEAKLAGRNRVCPCLTAPSTASA
ncbi:MAG: GGDEF domain-containing protein [Lautropia sp.]|nr:GGDEF domain-containing protein [Lautropia sp.]